MVAVEPWTQGHQGGSLDPPQWEKLSSQGTGLGRSLEVEEEVEATPGLSLGCTCWRLDPLKVCRGVTEAFPA